MLARIFDISLHVAMANIKMYSNIHSYWSTAIIDSFCAICSNNVKEEINVTIDSTEKMFEYGLKLFETSSDGYWFSKW